MTTAPRKEFVFRSDPLDGTIGGALDPTPPPDARPAGADGEIDVAERIRQAHERISTWEAERKSLNERISAEIEMLQKYGINRHALQAARRYAKADPKQREGLDASYDTCRRALGVPIQATLALN